MIDDIVARLDSSYAFLGDPLHLEAREEIGRLRAEIQELKKNSTIFILERAAAICQNADLREEIEKLRAVLDKIANGPRDADNSYLDLFVELKLEARAALEGEKAND